MREFKVGEYVRNLGKKSKFYGRVGRIVEIGWTVNVKYEGFKEIGMHPKEILEHSEGEHFDDDLFNF